MHKMQLANRSSPFQIDGNQLFCQGSNLNFNEKDSMDRKYGNWFVELVCNS